jgi:hypothetical protein
MSGAPRTIAGIVIRTERAKFVGLWLLIGLIGAGACSLKWPSAHFVDEYLPVGNDSFYHARRILDTVADPSAFYEVDYKIHAPEGSLLTWPWGYDYGMAWLVKAGLALGLAHDPMAILIWIPVAAVFLSIGLIMLIARRLGLSNGLAALAGLATALSPLTQYLHGVGQIDHHYAEYIFVLATIACGLRWLSRPDDTRAAAVLGAVLGMAPAIHNGLFILQVPILATLLVLWLQNIRMPMRTTGAFAAALLVTTVAILVPSLPFRLGLFEFYTLSWFHLYIAAGTAIASLALAAFAKNARNVTLLAVLAGVLLFPLARQIVMARAFLAGTIARLETIAEMKPLLPMVLHGAGRTSLSYSYSLLFWVSPLAVAYCVWRGWQERATARVLFWMSCILGFALLLTQLRLHYFGSYALYLPWLILAQTCLTRWESRSKLVMLSVGLVFLLAYWPAARYVLPSVNSPAGDASFRVLRPILEDLRKACAQDPGIVLADNDAGHYIRYYTDCSVIANNFLLTPQHEQKVRQIDYLTSIPAGAFPGVAPFVRYILLRPVAIFRVENGNQMKYMSYSQRTAPLIQDLLLKPLDQIPANYVLIEQASRHEEGTDGSLPYIRLFKVNPVGPQVLQTSTLQPSPKPAAH